MSDVEWKNSIDIEEMLELLITRQFPHAEPCNWQKGERKKRLFIRACFDCIWSQLPTQFKAVCELMDKDVSRQTSEEDKKAIWSAAQHLSDQYDTLLFALGLDDIAGLCSSIAEMRVAFDREKQDHHFDEWQRLQQELRKQTALLRDIFGNPFRPVIVDPTWLSESVVGLANGIYTDRAFERMPILADALQDAGCVNDDILNHCREAGNHVRGCWVVDLLLGKE